MDAYPSQLSAAGPIALGLRRLPAHPSPSRAALRGDDAIEAEDGKAQGVLPEY